MTRALEWLSKAFALAGGAILAAITLMSVASIGGRLLNHPIQGDFELVQVGCAVAIAFFLPWCQLARGNIIVDFFTTRASAATRERLDALGAVLVGLVAALICWRTAVGSMAAYENQETSMLIAVPIWIPYLLMTPGLLLTALVSFFIAWRRLAAGDPLE